MYLDMSHTETMYLDTFIQSYNIQCTPDIVA